MDLTLASSVIKFSDITHLIGKHLTEEKDGLKSLANLAAVNNQTKKTVNDFCDEYGNSLLSQINTNYPAVTILTPHFDDNTHIGRMARINFLTIIESTLKNLYPNIERYLENPEQKLTFTIKTQDTEAEMEDEAEAEAEAELEVEVEIETLTKLLFIQLKSENNNHDNYSDSEVYEDSEVSEDSEASEGSLAHQMTLQINAIDRLLALSEVTNTLPKECIQDLLHRFNIVPLEGLDFEGEDYPPLELVSSLAETLSNLADKNEFNRKTIGSHPGLIAHVIECIYMEISEKEQRYLVELLKNLAKENEDNQNEIATPRGIQVLTYLLSELQRTPDDYIERPELDIEIIETFNTLIKNNPTNQQSIGTHEANPAEPWFTDYDCVPTLVNCFIHTSFNSVKRYLLDTFRLLSEGNDENKTILGEHPGFIQSLADCFQSTENEELKSNLVLMLKELIKDHNDNLIRIATQPSFIEALEHYIQSIEDIQMC